MTLKAFDPTDFFCDFFGKGSYMFDATNLLQGLSIDKFKEIKVTYNDNCFHAEGFEHHPDFQAKEIEQLRKDLMERLSKEVGKIELIFDFMAFSVNQNVRKWHNDAQYTLPDQNASVNCFFDDMSPEVGGEFQVQPFSDTPSDDPELVATFHPKKFSIIIINQNRNFMHRAGPASIPRRMISFGCAMRDINPLLMEYPIV